MENKTVLSSAILNFYGAINDAFDNYETEKKVKINSSEKVEKYYADLAEHVIAVSQFISGSYFYPENYGVKSTGIELIGLMSDLDKDELYKQVFVVSYQNMSDEEKKDSKFADCLAFSKYLQVLFTLKVKNDEIKKMRKKHKRK